MLFVYIFIVGLVVLLIVEGFLLKAEEKRRQNERSQEYYEQMYADAVTLEEEINTLKQYRHELSRYMRILKKMADKTGSDEADDYARYLKILQNEADALQAIEPELEAEETGMSYPA